MYSALIIDDEADARNVMRELLRLFCPLISQFAEAEDTRQAIDATRAATFDFAFVDIQLNGENGIDLAKQISHRCANIIFVTAYDEYAVEAFQTAAIHYLLKPVDPELLQQAIAKAQLEPAEEDKLKDRIFLKTREQMIVMKHQRIAYLVGDGNYATFVDRSGDRLVVSHNLSYYEKLIGSSQFFRIHQSYLVNLDLVARVRPDVKPGSFLVELTSGDTLPLARRRKDAFLKALVGCSRS